MDIVLVKWRDIKSESGWTDKKDWNTKLVPPVLTSVGVYVGDANDALYLAMDVEEGEEGDYGSLQCIPKGCILGVTRMTI